MNVFQQVIKIIAICLSIFIIVNIFGAIIFGVTLFTNIASRDKYKDKNNENIEVSNFSETYQDVNNIDIELIASNITIKLGEELKFEGKSENNTFVSKVVNDTLKIRENKKWSWGNNSSENVILYIPENVNLNEIAIDTGAGKVNIERIIAKRLDIDHGAGNLEISDSQFNKADIDGGAGKIDIKNSKLNDLDLDAGVGRIDVLAELTGKSKIDCGIGEMNINLIGNKEEYKIRAEKGIGSFNIDGEKASSETIYGSGDNIIELDGGIGSINVRFIK